MGLLFGGNRRPDLRQREKYKVNFARKGRLLDSAIPQMQRLLNIQAMKTPSPSFEAHWCDTAKHKLVIVLNFVVSSELLTVQVLV